MLTRTVDLSLEADLDVVAEVAFGLAESIRDDHPDRVFRETVSLCELHPARAAQVMLALAAWFDPEVSVKILWSRVEAITELRAS